MEGQNREVGEVTELGGYRSSEVVVSDPQRSECGQVSEFWRRAALGASGLGRCRCRFGLSGQYDRGRVGGCQGGILGNMSLGGIPAYAGMTGGGGIRRDGAGYDVMGVGMT